LYLLKFVGPISPSEISLDESLGISTNSEEKLSLSSSSSFFFEKQLRLQVNYFLRVCDKLQMSLSPF